MSHRLLWAITMLYILVAGVAAARADTARQDLAAIAAAAERHASQRARQQRFEAITARAHRLDARLQLAACGHTLETFSAPGKAAGRSTVGVRCNAPQPWTLYVPVSVSASLKALVLRTSLPRGTILQESHLELRLQPAQSLRGDYIVDANVARGKSLRRDMQSGSLLTMQQLATPNTVKRGQSTLLLASLNNIEVKMHGTALANGAAGDIIAVRNNTSGKTVEGVITENGSVRVQ